jgi:hypothetical protein
MWKFYAAIALIWLALMPPFFTGGACNREFEQFSKLLNESGAKVRNPQAASAWWAEQGVPHQVITPEACRQVKPRFLEHCPIGTLVRAEVPVKNLVCSVYRDANIRVGLHYTDKGRLAQVAADMKPDKYVWIPLIDARLYWGR